MTQQRIGIYPGTFDPITKGHVDIITRAAQSLTDLLIVSVAKNIGKNPLFSINERTELVQYEIARLPTTLQSRIVVKSFNKLLIQYAAEQQASFIIRAFGRILILNMNFR